jgi:hypothetical protein
MRRAALVLGTLAAALAGCGGDAAPEPAPVASATPGATASPAQAATPAAPPTRAVRFRATDGRRVEGRFSEGRGRNAPAVVLLHEIRGGPDQWTPLLGSLHEAGFATLAYRSRPSIVESERLPDAIGALRWLRSRRGVDGSRLGMVGASIGASTTVLAMAGEGGRLARAAVALSPPDSSDIWDLQGRGRYRPHDLLLVSDQRESSSAEGMLEGARRSRALVSERPGHGVALLPEPEVRRALLRWLQTRVR